MSIGSKLQILLAFLCLAKGCAVSTANLYMFRTCEINNKCSIHLIWLSILLHTSFQNVIVCSQSSSASVCLGKSSSNTAHSRYCCGCREPMWYSIETPGTYVICPSTAALLSVCSWAEEIALSFWTSKAWRRKSSFNPDMNTYRTRTKEYNSLFPRNLQVW